MIATAVPALVLATLPAAPAAALDPDLAVSQYVVSSWSVDDGLPQNSVLSIAQTPDGYLWLGTYDGLVRFDGARFTIYDTATSPEIGDDVLSVVAADTLRDGLWIGTNGGEVMFLGGGRFRSFDRPAGRPPAAVTALLTASDGTVWVGTRAGLARIADDRLEAVPLGDSFDGVFVWSIAEGRDGELWIGTNDSGVLRVPAATTSAHPAGDGLDDMSVNTLYYDPGDDTLWAGTASAGVVCLRGGRWERPELGDRLPRHITEIVRDRDGVLWIGTWEGLFRVGPDGAEAFPADDMLGGESIESVLEDREGILWIGTYRAGLAQLRTGKVTMFTTREGLSEDRIRPVLADRHGAIWIGTVGGGVNRLAGGAVEVFSTDSGLAADRVWSLLEADDGAIWMGTYGGGVSRLADGTFTTLSTARGLSHDTVRALMEDREGRVWIGTDGGGIDVSAPDGSLSHLGAPDGLPSDFVYSLLEDRSGTVWIGTFGGGLVRFRDGRLEVFDSGRGMTADIVWSLTESDDGTLWIGTNEGLYRYRSEQLTAYGVRDGLPTEAVFQVLDDRRGRLWMSSQSGIASVAVSDFDRLDAGEIEELPFEIIDRSEGLRTRACNGPASPAGAMDDRGRLWFPTTRGLAMIDPDALPVNRLPPPVHLESVTVDGVLLEAPRQVVLEPGAERFEFRFTALSLLAPERVRFRYRLDGYDDDWSEPSRDRRAHYTNLPPGDYTFRVIAANNDGIWNRTGAAARITLEPFFWQTAWFYLACAAGMFVLGVGAAMVRIQVLKRRQRVLAALVEERTRELDEANRELARMARIDGLTGIANQHRLQEFLDHEWRRCARSREPLSVVMIDVDFFKKYNDRYGHQAGDDCLRAVAGIAERTAGRPGDLVARYGGEEFIVVLSGSGHPSAMEVAEKIRTALGEAAIPHEDGLGGRVSISAGVATAVPAEGMTTASLIRLADAALYCAKRAGRNRVASTDDLSRPL